MSEAKRTENGLRVGRLEMPAPGSRTPTGLLSPRCLKRKEAAPYMGLSLRVFDKIKHRYRVVIHGVVRYDRVLMDRDIDLAHAA